MAGLTFTTFIYLSLSKILPHSYLSPTLSPLSILLFSSRFYFKHVITISLNQGFSRTLKNIHQCPGFLYLQGGFELIHLRFKYQSDSNAARIENYSIRHTSVTWGQYISITRALKKLPMLGSHPPEILLWLVISGGVWHEGFWKLPICFKCAVKVESWGIFEPCHREACQDRRLGTVSASECYSGQLRQRWKQRLPLLIQQPIASLTAFPIKCKVKPGEGNSNTLQYSCLENSMDRGVWKDSVHGVTKSQTRLSNKHLRTCTHTHK